MNTRIAQLFLHRFVMLVIFLPFSCLSLETDTISSGLTIKDPDTIVSSKQVFKLGFFTPADTTNRYLGVFYAMSEETVVWAANRGTPLKDSSSSVTISKDGNLVLINSRNQTVWSTNATTSPLNTTLQILDSGNLVLRDQATGATIWESFSIPNCFLPTMKISQNIKTGKKVFTSSWKNASDPAEGSYTGEIEALSILQYFTMKNGRPFWRSGQWNGLFFIGIKSMFDSYLYQFRVEDDHNGTFNFTAPEGKNLMKMCLNSSGNLVQTLWIQQKKSWITSWWALESDCDFYGKCGPFGSCNVQDSPICSCMRGFEPVRKDEWGRGNWSSGCRRKNRLQCNRGGGGDEDGFVRMPFMKVPDSAEQFPWRQEGDCQNRCLRNCSCIAYAHEPNIGCMLWSHTLIDSQEFNTVGVDLYIRLSASDLDNSKDRKLYIIIPVVAFVSASVLAFIAWCLIVKRKGDETKDKNIVNSGPKKSSESDAILLEDESERVDIELVPFFTFETIANATEQFHENNLLGRGGFGPVYKGNLANGEEIAVKRLSVASRQGTHEFMNEVIVISKLQHRNLVRLLGCCVEKEEKMLIYEYMPNKSLEMCLFDSRLPSQNVLDWTKRFNIIEGIARGILYLHKDSRLTIIHRDLKPSNVLLDEDWNPKISDFGMARIFGGNEDHGRTARVVGTYGYMAPEYATEGRFSEKSDVYSFGVLVLEILKGKKNLHYYNNEWSLGLLGCAWKLWSENNGLAFVDERIANPKLEIELEICIQIALLCVQEFPRDRPSIQTVLSMLSHEIYDLPAPEQPVSAEKWNESRRHAGYYSTNELTLTVLDGR
ncbi:hypothetical protein ACS0TY_031229 [Phlomoides rotata]